MDADARPSALTPREIKRRDTRYERIRDSSLPQDCSLKRRTVLRLGIRLFGPWGLAFVGIRGLGREGDNGTLARSQAS